MSRCALPIQGVYECIMPFAGLQSLLSVQSSYQLSQHSTAALALTYQQGAGLGMQVSLCLAFALLFVYCLPLQRSKQGIWLFCFHMKSAHVLCQLNTLVFVQSGKHFTF